VRSTTPCRSVPAQRPALEVADIVRAHGEALRREYVLTPDQLAVLRDIERCRTEQLGGHLDVCTECGHERPSYNSCRNRHCPKCQSLAQARWVDGRAKRVLPVHYFHVVFTLPAQLRPFAKAAPEVIYDMLFACASQTLLELGHDPDRLGGQLGITMVLHTWARDLSYHPHVHCIVTGGGLSQDGLRWIQARPAFLFHVKVMGKLFRGKFLHALVEAYKAGRLGVEGQCPCDERSFRRLCKKLGRTKWVAYCKRPMGGPEQVIRYLGQYTHRVGISNYRLLSMDEGGVTFHTKDGKTVTLPGVQFLRRFVAHVLPHSFVKIRHYGLMAASNATTRLEKARTLLGGGTCMPLPDASSEAEPTPPPDWEAQLLRLTGLDLGVCPVCHSRSVVRRPLPTSQSRAPPCSEAA
jgi:hypothetical protein